MDFNLHVQPEQEPLIPDIQFTGIDGLDDAQMASVDFTAGNLYDGKVFYKKQCRKNGYTRQMVTNGLVHMKATWGPDQLLKIRGWVRREPRAAMQFNDGNGEVLICGPDERELNLINNNDVPIVNEDGSLTASFSVDLGELYHGPVQPVFKLAKSDMGSLNQFQLIIQLVFLHGPPSQKFYSPTFLLCTKRPDAQSQPFIGGKRPRQDAGESSSGSPARNSPLAPSLTGSMDSGLSDSIQRHKRILVDELDAKTAHIGDLVAHDFHLETSKADIAYHLKIKNPQLYEKLHEGEIVGFYEDEESGETYIQPLRSGNIHNAVHAGVVSRSHWVEGHKPRDTDIKTDTVCVIGIVNVQVVGSIENGERIYASRDHPGKGIPQSHMPVGSFLRKKHVLLGMALESKRSSKSLDEVHQVKCFVCVVLDVSRQELLQEIEDLYEVNEKKTEEQIKQASKRTWRRLKCYFAIGLVILALIIFILYQWLAPGSMFRYWLCRRGSIPDHDLNFNYRDPIRGWHFHVHGIQFTYYGLLKKVGVKFSRVNETEKGRASYYLNLDRCAYYWGDGVTGNSIGGRKYVAGGRILSAVRNCSEVYENIEIEDRWDYIKNQTHVSCTNMPE